MASLKIKNGAKREVAKGYVEVEGQCVVLRQTLAKNESRLIFAYCLSPGEIVRSDGEDYIVEF